MKITSALFLLFFLISCSSTKTGDAVEQESETTAESEADKTFDECFSIPDATFDQTVTGCSQGFYKVLNDQFVLRIIPDVELDFGDCIEWTIDPAETNQGVELIIFEKGKASLMNICTGIISNQAVQPLKLLNKCRGLIIIGKSDPTEYLGKETAKMTFQCEQLIFFDPDTYEEIIIRNQLLWKVLDKGTPQ